MKEKSRELLEARSQSVVKHNDLIQKSRYNLSLQEQKIILYLISKIKPEDEDFKLYEFSIQEFCEVCGIDEKNGKNYSDLKETIKDLTDKSNWAIIQKDGRETETLLRWIEKPYIDKNSGIIKIRLDNDMMPYLLNLQKQFTVYELYFTLGMRSKYSVRLYELLKSREFAGEYVFDVEELKIKMSAENYTTYKDFRVYALEIALREINDVSDMYVTYTATKKGKKYDKIIFNIQSIKDPVKRLEIIRKIDRILNPEQIQG